MAGKTTSSNKAKIARRVIEVLEYFDDTHKEATVMDIVRRYNRPQSSTSELLSSLVELGLLYKDPYSRAYSLTPRAALLGTSGQPELVRDGRIVRLMDRLVAQTNLSVALTSMVGLDAQIVNWRHSPRALAATRELAGGVKEPLVQSASGWLMLSTVARQRCEGMVRRLNAEADDTSKFNFSEMMARIDACREPRHVFGPTGFNTGTEALCALLPRQPEGHPLAISVVYSKDDKINPEALIQCMSDAMRKCLPDPEATTNIEQFSHAA
ncbi:helix-turn-helix domain-containing protein [Novosphingobium mangrovi (ex Huang et al. 2023)]|uniref:Helix-turn-helix domain-containing protein n=1 Tax=Novosphingobium mangrovi (ex Huang et al. 2023) TaxID=2976432 RepID=A0ABT2I7M2_9SPHN|nr:helix-turn-helix domain-containing protein [Novosphingobium mangrovi (ex Huang et al. 2023)]MCT2400807.1 helix-turn-helix domain-containing protein [Novosphingobium mangrovi (ex Huang et al. 2023)]